MRASVVDRVLHGDESVCPTWDGFEEGSGEGGSRSDSLAETRHKACACAGEVSQIELI